MTRQNFAERISAGLAGWFQQLAAQDLHEEVGEDSVRVELVRTINAQQSYKAKTSQRPTNWPANDKRRVDVAVLGTSIGAGGWYGSIELKWPGTSNDVAAVRTDIVQDSIRVAFSQTSNLNAKFLVLGGSQAAIYRLFDKPHTAGSVKESQRVEFTKLFSRSLLAPAARLTNADLLSYFPNAKARIDSTVVLGWTRRFATKLISHTEVKVGSTVCGEVFVWQCLK